MALLAWVTSSEALLARDRPSAPEPTLLTLALDYKLLICRSRSISLHRRCSSRKFPSVMRIIAAATSVSAKSSGRKVQPNSAHFCVRMNCISSFESGRNGCTKPTRE